MTFFVFLGTDRSDGAVTRAAVRERHRAYLRDPGGHPVRVRIGGPTFTEDGAAMNGTMLVVEADSLEAVQAFLADDPYARAGLFAETVVRPWLWGLGQPDQDAAPSQGSPSP